MGILKLHRPKDDGGVSQLNGRAYFRQAAEELQIAGLDPDQIQEMPRPEQVKRGHRKSRVGGRIAEDLRHLSEEETDERAAGSEEFLSREAVVFTAEEDASQP
jgi:hypothetical protein